MQPTINTNRLNLRPLKEEDVLHVKNYLADPIMADLNPILASFSVDGFKEWTEELPVLFKKKLCFTYAIELNKTFIGICEARFFHDPCIGELGYWIGKSHWGNGYCTEALQALILHLDSDYSVQRFQAKVLSQNKGSIKVLKKLGFSPHDPPGSEGELAFTLELD